MRRSPIYILGRASTDHLDSFKKDVLAYAIQMASSIRNLGLTPLQINESVSASIDKVFDRYKQNINGQILGNLVREQVISDLKDACTNNLPERLSRVKWPEPVCISMIHHRKKSVKKYRILKLIGLRNLPMHQLDKVIRNISPYLNVRQNKLLLFISTSAQDHSHSLLSKKMQVKRSTITNDIRVIDFCLTKILKTLNLKVVYAENPKNV